MGHMAYVTLADDEQIPALDELRETKGERTRRRILEEAIARFGARGFRGTSVSEVARSVGLTQAAAYAYFDSKTALYRAAVDADADALIADARESLAGAPIRELLPGLIAMLVAGLDEHPLAQRVMSGQDAEALGRLVDLPGLERVTADLAAALRDEQTAGTVRSDVDPEALAQGVQAIIFGLVLSAAQVGGTPRPAVIMGVLHALDALTRPIDR